MPLFPENSLLDRVDKSISTLFFSMELSTSAELVLTLPSMWFGMPTTAWGFFPLVLDWYSEFTDFNQHRGVAQSDWLRRTEFFARIEPSSYPRLANALEFVESHFHNLEAFQYFAISAASFLVWTTFFIRFVTAGRMVRVYSLIGTMMIPASIIPLLLARRLGLRHNRPGCFFVVAWCTVVALTSVLKTVAGRLRPVVAPSLESHFKTVKRAFPELQSMLRVGETVFESFPSGDTAGSAVFSATLYLMNAPRWTAAISLLTGFCRMYFHAHHFLDVIVGLALGWGGTLGLYGLLARSSFPDPLQAFNEMHVVGAVVIFILVHVVLIRNKPKLPEKYVVPNRRGF